jgi:hypothetical protein
LKRGPAVVGGGIAVEATGESEMEMSLEMVAPAVEDLEESA